MFLRSRPEKSLNELSAEFARSVPVPKTIEYKTIQILLDDAEKWRNVGDRELEKKTWALISEKAGMYSSGTKENYQTGSKLQTVAVDPIFPCDTT